MTHPAGRPGRVGGILKASSVMGSASAVAILSGAAKSKASALLLGPAGFGLLAMLQSATGLVAALAGAGMATSAVQHIAATAADEGPAGVAHARRAISWASWGAGASGAVALASASGPLSVLLFGSGEHSRALALLSIGVLATVVSGGQTALINGLQRVKDLAHVNVCGALVSMLVTTAALWAWGEAGIVAAALSMPLSNWAASSWKARVVELPPVPVELPRLRRSLEKVLSLGTVFMAAAFMLMASQFAARTIITKRLGLDATGYFQAAWTISMMYLGFVLNAMSADYYPRLSAVSEDREASTRLVNEQMVVTLWLGAPAVVGMLCFSPLLIRTLYSPEFAPSVGVLRWQLLGDVFKIASWAIAFVLLAGRHGREFILAELSFHAAYLGLLYLTLPAWGLQAAGVSFLAAYILYLLAVWGLARRRTGFSWSPEAGRAFCAVLVCAGTAALLPRSAGALPALALTAATGGHSLWRLRAMTREPSV